MNYVLPTLAIVFILFTIVWMAFGKKQRVKKSTTIKPIRKPTVETAKTPFSNKRHNRQIHNTGAKIYTKGNFLNISGLPPDIYGMRLFNRRGYSHKQTNK